MRLQRVRRGLLFLSFLAFPVTFIYLSPMLALRGSYEGVVTAGLLVWFLVLLASVLAGRVFCSYLCPLGGLQECLDATLPRPHLEIRRLRVVKYVVWAAWVGLIAVFATRSGLRSLRLQEGIEGFPLYGPHSAIAFFSFSGLAAASTFGFGKRGFCHYLCFFAPLTILGSRLSDLLHLPIPRIRVMHPEQCRQCKRCSAACPMGLEPAEMAASGAVRSRECISCGTCAAVCEAGVLRYGVWRR